MVSRVMRILEAFGVGDISLSATEIARRAEIPTPSAHRIINDLVETGMLERDQDRKVRIGIRLWGVATRASSVLSLREVALPYLEELQGIVRQHAQLSVLDQKEVLYLEKLSSKLAGGTNIGVAGTRLPALSCSTGIVLTAFASAEIREDILAHGRITKFTERTILDREVLRQLVSKTQQVGYCLAIGWMTQDTAALAVPVLGSDGVARAALSVTTSRGMKEKVTELVPALSTVARLISRDMNELHPRPDPRVHSLRQKIRRSVETN